MADPRFYAKIDVGYLGNPKLGEFIDEQPRVVLMHLAAILYCRQHLTDGRFPIRLVARAASASYCGSQCEGQCDFCAATNADLFDRVDSKQAEVHDYLKHQDSAEKVVARKSAGQAGAAARWSKEKDADRNAGSNANRNAGSNAEERRGEDKGGARPRAASRALPHDWQPTDKHARYADEHNIDLQAQAMRFRTDAEAKDKRYANWNAAFTNWLTKALEYGQTKRSPAGSDPWAHVPIVRPGGAS